MIHLHFSTEDLLRIRFSFSPVWEGVSSLRTLGAGRRNGLHTPWLRWVESRLEDVDVDLLTAVVRPTGYLPDFLHPTLSHRSAGFAHGLSEVAATDSRLVAAELSHLAEHRVAQQGPGRAGRVRTLRGLAGEPRAGLARIVAELDRYWRAAVEPHWSRIEALLHADLRYRLDQLAAGGVELLFRTLHPSLRFADDTLEIVKYYEGHAELRGRGLLLVPCVFAWPDVIVRTADPQPAVTYSPRGVGRLWESAAGAGRASLVDVLGRSRATILTQLDLPMSTTQLADQLDRTAPTLNVHLKALQAAGIVSARRAGRMVLYSRTELGDSLLAGPE